MSTSVKMKVGIVCDDYKVECFKKELENNGFTDYEIFPFSKRAFTIKVNTPQQELNRLQKLVERVQRLLGHNHN